MARRKRLRKIARDWTVAILGVVGLGLAALAWSREPSRRPIALAMSAGRPEGARQRIAEILAREAGRRGVRVQWQPTAGSEQALDQVDAGRLDAALVQGGLDPGGRRNVRQVAALHVEPLHLLVKEEIFAEVARNLAALRGKTINLSEFGSGTHCLASEVLAFAGLEAARGDYRATTLGYAELGRQADRARLPDAVFMVSTLPLGVARELVTRHRYRLVALPFASAFALGALEQDPAPARAGRWPERVERQHVCDATIPAFTYRVEPGVPAEEIHTLGTRLLLVAHKDVPVEAIGRLLETAFDAPFARASHAGLDPKVLELPPELPWHDGTIAYLRRTKPLIAGDFVDLLEKELSIGGAVLGGGFFLVQWLRRRYRARRDRGFEAYILKVADVERRAMALELAATLDLPALLLLQKDLARLKAEALEKFADGELEGEELMSGFLTHVSDTRDYLTRLILHQRDNLEEEAQLQGRRPQALWREVVGEGRPLDAAADLGP
jgi:TRAP-type uncharacterized transport system substrate-binding protein